MKRYTYDVFFEYDDETGEAAIAAAKDVVRSSLDDAELGVEELSAGGPRSDIKPYPVTVRVRISEMENNVRSRLDDALYDDESVIGIGHVR